MSRNAYITEAFKQFNTLMEEDEEIITSEEMPIYDIDSEKMHDFLDTAGEDVEDIIDLEAEVEEDLKQSYVGKVILDCNVCHSNIFIDKDEITVDEEGNANIDLECPYCMSNEGYTIIGQVEPYSEEEPEEEIEVEDELDIEEPEEEIEVEEDEEEVFEESLNESCDKEEIDECGDPEIMEESLKFDFDKDETGPFVSILMNKSGKKFIDKFTDSSTLPTVYDENGDEYYLIDNKMPCYNKVKKVLSGINESLKEDIQDVSITTDEETMTMTTKEDGGVEIETTPVETAEEEFIEDEVIEEPEEEIETGEEVIAPLEDGVEDEIELHSEIDALDADEIEALENEEPEDMEDMDEIEVEDFDEESFNELGESYLKEQYDNVTGFKTVNAKVFDGSLIVEGIIRFASGNAKGTSFVFEATKARKNGILFEGYNKQISRGKKTFKLDCDLIEGCIKPVKMSYNYMTKNELNESVRVNGTCKVGK